jgi:4-amino-4-deoxy-L-arabinose transferase-like glycosyltransferase
MPSAVIGTLTIVVLFFLTRELTKSSRTGLVASGLLAVSPWHIHFSRVGQENIYLPFFLGLSIFLFLYAKRNHSFLYWMSAGGSFGCSLFTYYPAYLLSPLIFIFLLITERKRLFTDKKALLSFLTFLLFVCLFLSQAMNNNIFNRSAQLKRYNEHKTTKDILVGMTTTYLGHFSPEFLFLKGDIGYHTHFITRYSVRGMGQLYLFQLPLLLIGCVVLWKRQKKILFLLTGLFLLYPIGSTLVPFADGGGPFATRSMFGIIPCTILSAIGLTALLSLWSHGRIQKLIIFLCVMGMEISVSWYAYLYIHRYNDYSSDFWGWQYGARTLMKYALDHKNLYDEIIIPDSAFNTPEIFLKFYDPLNTCTGICLVGDSQRKYNKNLKQLFMIPNTDKATPSLMRRFTIHKTILFPNGNPAFFIGTFQPQSGSPMMSR